MINWILCLLGICVYFLRRYDNRKHKNTPVSFSFWIADNWPELLTTLFLNTAIMIIIHLPGTTVDMNPIFSQLPFGLNVAGLPTLSFFLGLGLTWTFYSLFRSKTK